MVARIVKPEAFQIHFFYKNRKFWVEAGFFLIFTNFQPHLPLTLLKNKLHRLFLFG